MINIGLYLFSKNKELRKNINQSDGDLLMEKYINLDKIGINSPDVTVYITVIHAISKD
ncbi:hypothetical protein LNA01_01810 [Companilactobacillus nantensis]|nr:hypothetical protein LNA01_01810 [Companilactobacillus nantensis]